jgi:hypothetical protein
MYDGARFDPPAPLALVTLYNPASGQMWTNVPMLLDTGADVSLIPHVALDRLNLHPLPDKQFELVSFEGTASLASAVQLELSFLDRTFRGQFLLIDQEWGIPGRNVLNAVSVLLDGPQLNWREANSR